eukprot:sb/3468354/
MKEQEELFLFYEGAEQIFYLRAVSIRLPCSQTSLNMAHNCSKGSEASDVHCEMRGTQASDNARKSIVNELKKAEFRLAKPKSIDKSDTSELTDPSIVIEEIKEKLSSTNNADSKGDLEKTRHADFKGEKSRHTGRSTATKVGFFEVVTPPWVARKFLFALLRTPKIMLFVGILFWLSRLCFSVNLVKPKFYGLPKLCSFQFSVISGFLLKSESKWGLSRTNTTPCDKRGVTTSKNPTLCLISCGNIVILFRASSESNPGLFAE